MNIHEYQGKAVLKEFGAPVSAGFPALTVAEAVEAARKLPGPLFHLTTRHPDENQILHAVRPSPNRS